MSYTKEVLQAAKERLNTRRMYAERIADEKREQLFDAAPRLREINEELASIGSKLALCVINQSAGESVVELRDRSLALQDEYDRILRSMGFEHDYTKPHYHCDVCHDTGYVEGDNTTSVCDCYHKLLAEIACEQLNSLSPLALSTFEDFDLNKYSVQPDATGHIPRRRMTQIYDYCLQYADSFSTKSRNLFMVGGTGLGKTHLSLAIANRVLAQGFSVVYVSAPEILSRLEREHFSYQYQDENDTFNSLINCDLLILDDLGTEFQSAFSKSAVYNIFNSRLLKGLPTIMNTNIPLSELEGIYSPRFASRVIGACDRLFFIGQDNRI